MSQDPLQVLVDVRNSVQSGETMAEDEEKLDVFYRHALYPDAEGVFHFGLGH